MSETTDAEALAWIRKKLKLPDDTQMFSGQPTIAGTLHVWESHAYGYETYIKAYKCDNKQGEIARLTVANQELLMACKAVLAAIDRADLNGEVLWIKPPYQYDFVHESASERLADVIEKAEQPA